MTPGAVPHRFRKWVTAEFLPVICRRGGYVEIYTKVEALLDDRFAKSNSSLLLAKALLCRKRGSPEEEDLDEMH
jgi:prophage antirepressor-like protein